jgi:hypothetical protein
MAKSIYLIKSINSSFELKCLDLLTKSYILSNTENLIFKDWAHKQDSDMVSGSLTFNFEKPIIIKYSLSDSDTF